MPEPSVHDNFLYAYVVLSEQRRLVLYTEYRDGEPTELTDVEFHGVLAHHFIDASPENILFGVDEVPVAALLREHVRLFEDRRKYGWPVAAFTDIEDLIRQLERLAVRAFEISSSLGVCGFVLAEGVRYRARATRFTLGE